MWRTMLAFLRLAPATPAHVGRAALADLDAALERHAQTARRVEAGAHLLEIRAISDPNRAELRRLERERGDAIDAVFRGRDEA